MSHNGLPDVAQLFVELAAIASPSGNERAVAETVAAYLRDLALHVDEDDAGARIGSTIGNLYSRIEPASIDVTYRGKAAHAGMAPEEGRSALAAASRAIADLRLGRLDDITTASVGLTKGGTARNVGARGVLVHGRRARAHDAKGAPLPDNFFVNIEGVFGGPNLRHLGLWKAVPCAAIQCEGWVSVDFDYSQAPSGWITGETHAASHI